MTALEFRPGDRVLYHNIPGHQGTLLDERHPLIGRRIEDEAYAVTLVSRPIYVDPSFRQRFHSLCMDAGLSITQADRVLELLDAEASR